MHFLLPSIKCSAVPPSSRLLSSTVSLSKLCSTICNYRALCSTQKLEGAAEHSTNSSEKRICRLSFEFKSLYVIERCSKKSCGSSYCWRNRETLKYVPLWYNENTFCSQLRILLSVDLRVANFGILNSSSNVIIINREKLKRSSYKDDFEFYSLERARSHCAEKICLVLPKIPNVVQIVKFSIW